MGRTLTRLVVSAAEIRYQGVDAAPIFCPTVLLASKVGARPLLFLRVCFPRRHCVELNTVRTGTDILAHR